MRQFDRESDIPATHNIWSFMPVKINSGDEAAYALHLATKETVSRADLAVGFDRSLVVDPLLLVEGSQFYPRLLDDMNSATTSIHINEFGIRPGVVADRFAAILKAKASEGVAVRVLVDSRGSRPDRDSRDLFRDLASSGVELYVNRSFAPLASHGPVGGDQMLRWNVPNLLAVDHRKMIIVDGRVGWLGTAGIEDRFEDGRHHDLFVRVEGPVLHQMQAVFLASYRWLGGSYRTDEVARLFPEPEIAGQPVPAITLHNAPGRYRPISRAIVDLIESSRHSLDIMNPYIAHPRVFQRLIEAAGRGVRVQLVTPPLGVTRTTGYARLYHHARLIDAGVDVWIYPAVAHAKAFVRDGQDVLVGSCNLESWSLKRFFEIDLRIQSTDLADQFRRKLFDPDIERSVPGRPATGLKERALSAAFHLASPFL